MRRDAISVFLKKIAGVFIGLCFFSMVQATTYYSGGSLAPGSVNNWWTNTNATGSHPVNFTTAGDVFIVQNTHTMTSAANWTVTGTVQINSGGTLTIASPNVITVGSMLVTGTCNQNSSQTLSVTTLTVDGTFNCNSALGITATTITVNGTFNDILSGHITGAMTVTNGATYSLTGNTAPVIATATWNTGSTCVVSGITNATSVGGTAQTFYNFTWSSASSRNLTISPVRINGNLTFSNGGGSTRRVQLGVTSLIVGQNLNISGANANFVMCANTAASITVGGNMSVTAGIFNHSRGSARGTVNLSGNFSHTGGTITETGSGSGAIIFAKAGTQTYTSGGTLANTINFTVNSGSTLQMGTGASPAVISNGSIGTFTLASGATLGITSTAGITTTGASGNIQLTGTRTFATGANYLYNGNANQACGTGLTQNRPNNLQVNNPGNTVSLSAALIISGSLTLTAGTLNLAGLGADVGDLQGSGTITSGTAGAVSLKTGSNDGNSTFSGIIQNGSGTVSLIKNGAGNLTLSNANTFSGGATLTSGTITMGAANALSTASSCTLNGGTLKSGASGYSNTTSGTFNLTSNSTLDLGAGSHSLTFANSSGVSWTGGANLTVTGWTGGYNSTSGTAGKLFIGSTSGGLTVAQLKQIQFKNGSTYYKATILSTGEVVPTSTVLVLYNLSYPSPNTFLQTTLITPLTPTVVGFPNAFSVSPVLPAGLSLDLSTGIISGTPTTSTPTATYVVTASDGPNQTSFGIVITVHVPTTYYARATGLWDVTSTWSTVNGNAASASATTIPTVGDVVNIGFGTVDGDRTVTIPANSDVFCTTVNIGNTPAYSNSLTLANSTSSITVSGNVSILASNTTNKPNSLAINDGTGSVGGNITLNGGTAANRLTSLIINNGAISISGNLVLGANTASTALVTMSGGAGTLNLAGAFTIGTAGMLNAGTSSAFNFNGTAAQTVPIGASSNYNDLLINNTVSATLSAPITSSRVTGKLNVQSGKFYNGTFAIALDAAKDFSVAAGASFYLTGTSSMVTGASSLTFEPGSYVRYEGTNQTVSNEAYGNLYLGGSGVKSISGGATIEDDFNIYGTTAVTCGAPIAVAGDFTVSNGTTFTAGAFGHNVGGNFLNSGTFTATGSTFTFDGTVAQNIGGTTIPSFSDIVFAGSGAVLTSSIAAKNFTINSGSSLTTGSFNHTISGNFTNDGSLVGTGGTFTFNGAAPQSIDGSVNTIFNSLIVSSPARLTLAASDYITAANLTINSGAAFTISPLGKLEVTSTLSNLAGTSGLVIQSDATGSGSLIHSSSGVNATVQRYLTDNTGTYYYHTTTSPVANAFASVFLLAGAGPYLYQYNPAGTPSKWDNIVDVTTALTPGKGYLINYKTRTTAETISYTGSLNTGNFDLSLSSAGDGNNLVGNPYPCAIDWDSPSGWTFGNTDNYIAVWNPAVGSYGFYVRGVGTGTNGVTNIIPSGQGFFVNALSNTTLSMTNAVKVHDNSPIKSAQLRPNYFKLRITNDTNIFYDEVVVFYDLDATRNYDQGFEARKAFSIMKESSQMYTRADDGTNLAINAMPEGDNDSIVLYFKCGIQANYTLKLVESSGVQVSLTDLLTMKNENLLTNEYKFSGSPSDSVVRFIINSQMGGNTKIKPIPASKSEEVSITPTLNGLHLRNLTDQPLQGALTITSLLGRTIYQENITLATDEARYGFKSGIYIVSFRMNERVEVRKIFIQ